MNPKPKIGARKPGSRMNQAHGLTRDESRMMSGIMMSKGGSDNKGDDRPQTKVTMRRGSATWTAARMGMTAARTGMTAMRSKNGDGGNDRRFDGHDATATTARGWRRTTTAMDDGLDDGQDRSNNGGPASRAPVRTKR